MRIIIIVNGRAAIIATVCSASSPCSEVSNTAAVPEMISPQTNLTELAGFRLPLDVWIPRTTVAESADVIKKGRNKQDSDNGNKHSEREVL